MPRRPRTSRVVVALLVVAAVGVGLGVWIRASDPGDPSPHAVGGAAVKNDTPPARRPGAAALEADGTRPTPPPAPDDALRDVGLDVVVRTAADARPVADAEVIVRDDAGGDLGARRTAADGTARFDAMPGAARTLFVRAAGHVDAWLYLAPRSAPGSGVGTRAVDVALQRGTVVRGVVVEAVSARPVARADVSVRRGGTLDGISSWSSEGAFLSLATDDEGRFRADGVPLGEIVSIFVAAPGFVRATRALMFGDGANTQPEVRIHLERAATFVGRVLDADGVAADAAVVVAVDVSQAVAGLTDAESDAREAEDLEARLAPAGNLIHSQPSATCDATGAFTLDGLRPGRSYRVFAERRGAVRSRVSARLVAPAGGGRLPVGDLRLRRTGSLVVRVTDPQGTPVEGARARIDPWAGEELYAALHAADTAGVLRFAALAPGTHLVRVSGAGFVPQVVTCDVGSDVEREVRVVLARGTHVEGVVVDDRGVPVVDASVAATPVDVSGGDGAGGGASTDGAGRFRIDGLRATDHELTVVATGHGRGAPVRATAPTAGLRLTVPRAATARLRVLRPPSAAAAAELRVSVERLAGGGSSGTRPWGDGRVTLERLPPEPTRVVVSAAGFAPLALDVRLAPGGDHDLGDVSLREGLELRGRVTDVDGRGIAAARVRVQLPTLFEEAVAATGPDGAFRVPHLPDGDGLARIEADGYLVGRVTLSLREGAPAAAFVLARPHRVEGRLRGAPGSELAALSVALHLEGDPPPGVPREQSVTPDATGAFALDVAEGVHRVEVRAPDGRVCSPPDVRWRVPVEGPLELEVR